MGDSKMSNDTMKSNDQSIPVSILGALPSLYEPCILSQLNQNNDIERLRALVVSQAEAPLSLPISDTELRITAVPTKHLLQSPNNQSNNQSNNQTDNVYWSWHNPTHSHTSNDSITPLAIDDPAYRDYLISQLSLSQNVLANLTQKKSRVSSHIDALHRYNELKDVGQTLLGKLAEQQGCMTRDMYPKYGLDLED